MALWFSGRQFANHIILTAFRFDSQSQDHNKNMNIKKIPKEGFTLLEIMIVTAIISLLAAIAIPNFMKARSEAQQKTCCSNQVKMNQAVDQWALEQRKKVGDAVAENEVVQYLKGGKPKCPSGGSYTFDDLNATGIEAHCSITNGNAPHIAGINL